VTRDQHRCTVMTAVDSNIVEWRICEMRERQKERKTKNGTKKMNDTKEERQETKGRKEVKNKEEKTLEKQKGERNKINGSKRPVHLMILTVAQTTIRASNDCTIQHNELERIGLVQESWTIANCPYGALNTTPGKHIGQLR